MKVSGDPGQVPCHYLAIAACVILSYFHSIHSNLCLLLLYCYVLSCNSNSFGSISSLDFSFMMY